MNIVKVTTILELFFAFNVTKDKDSLEIEESEYDDQYFRWTKDSFKHSQKLTVIFNDHRIVIFNTERMRDRLKANMSKVQHDKDKINFGCNFNIIADIVEVIHAEEMTDQEVIEFNTPVKREKTKREEYDEMLGRNQKNKVDIQNKKS